MKPNKAFKQKSNSPLRFPTPKNQCDRSVSTYTNFCILKLIQHQLGLEAMLEYMSQGTFNALKKAYDDKWYPKSHEDELREKWGRFWDSVSGGQDDWFKKALEIGVFSVLLDKFKDELVEKVENDYDLTADKVVKFIHELHKQYKGEK